MFLTKFFKNHLTIPQATNLFEEVKSQTHPDTADLKRLVDFHKAPVGTKTEMQKHVCTLVGKAAKFKGKKKKWWKTQTLYWQGEAIPRDSKRYQELLDKAFNALAENSSFRRALLATQNATLTHNMGKKKTSETVLTKNEFTSRLTAIRTRLQNEKD